MIPTTVVLLAALLAAGLAVSRFILTGAEVLRAWCRNRSKEAHRG